MGFDLEISVPALTVFIQGILSFFSPCVLPLVPLYVGYLAGGAKTVEADGTIRYPRGRVMWNTLFFVLGISATFFLLGFGFTALGQFFSDNRLWFARISGIIMVLFGLYQLGVFGHSMALEREQWRWTSMIRQPEFVDQAVFTWAAAQLAAKKPQLPVARARFLYHSDGLCVQMMHRGSYASEGKSFAAMTAFMQEHGLVQRESWHREIYLGDPRRTREENLRTVLRLPVRQV